jgi:imidazolonepropionase
LGIIRDGAVLIRNGIIEELGLTRRVENLAGARNALEVNAVGRIVMPGFVDSHTHLAFPPSGASSAGCDAGVRAVMTVSPKLLSARARVHLDAMVRHGSTTVEAKTGCGDNLSAEVKVLRSLAALRTTPIDLASTYLLRTVVNGGPIGDLEWIVEATRATREFLPLIQRRGLAFCADLEWEPNPKLYPTFLRYLEVARELGLKRKVQDHHESPSGSVLAAVENGVLSIDHFMRHDALEMTMLSRGPTILTLTPTTLLFGDGRAAPARALVDSGAAVALASNFNPVESPILSMQTVIWLACRHLHLRPAEAIAASTINGAHALGIADRVGSLEAGKAADLVMLNMGDYSEFGHRLGANAIHLVMKRGEFIYREGRVGPPVKSVTERPSGTP